MNWQETSDLSQLQCGDIIELPSKVVGTSPILPGFVVRFVKHYGIIVNDGGVLKVLHNPFGGKPLIEPIEKVFSDRPLGRLMRTGLSSEEVMNRWQQCDIDRKHCSDTPYGFFNFNCEDFVRKICQCNIGEDQRKLWGIGVVTGVIAVVVIVLLIKTIR